MRLFFETSISYYSQEANKTIKQVYLVQALSFTEAEANMTTYLGDCDIKDFDIKGIKKVKFEELVYRSVEEDYSFFEAKVKIRYEGQKENPYKFLVAGNSFEDATEQVKDFISDSEGFPNVVKVEARQIKDLVMVKDCKENGSIIIGFEEQKVLEDRINLSFISHQILAEIKLEK